MEKLSALLHRGRRRGLAGAARRVGWDPGPRDESLLRHLEEFLAASGPAVVAVLSGTDRSPVAAALRRADGQLGVARVHDFDAGTDADLLHVSMSAVGRFDLAVVDAPGPCWPDLLEQALFHLRPGGQLVFRGVLPPGTAPGKVRQPLVRRLRRLERVPGDAAVRPGKRRRQEDRRALAAAIGGWDAVGPHVVVTNAVSALAKLRHEDVDPLLERPGLPRGRLVERVPAVRFTARCEVSQSESDVRTSEVREIEAPEVSLREYDAVVCAPRQVVVQDSVILPDSFRHSHRRRYRSSAVEDLAPGFVREPEWERPPARLPGVFFHLDSEFQGHYGHLLTEQLSRMWAWPLVKAAAPEAKLLLGTREPRTTLHPHERELLEALDVPRDDVVLFDRPVRVDRLFAATPMFAQPGYVHPAIATTWQRLGRSLAGRAPSGTYPERIFCARRTGKRACHNAAEVEDLFAGHGFTIVHPEDFSLAEQAMLFRSAGVVAGYAGAALFNICYTAEPKDLVMIVPESYTAQNEYLMAAVQGHRLSIAWCRSDVPQPGRGTDAAAYQSPFTFDFDREGAWLRARLGELG